MILRCREELISQLQDQIQLFEDDGAQLRDQVRRDSSQSETSEICALQRIMILFSPFNHRFCFSQIRQNQLRHEDEIMRLKEQLSDAQRFVH